MLKTLIGKQFMEIYRSYFYNAKKNEVRDKGTTLFMLIGGFSIIIIILGAMFFFIASLLCENLLILDLDWFYLVLMGLMAIALGTFGSVFSTYSSLYLAKDNDLLLSLPIPVDKIIASRLITVYLMGLMYSGLVAVPTVIVYWLQANNFTLGIFVSGILFVLAISLIVLLLSCLLGYAVARLSVKIKHNNILIALLSLLFIAAYYYFYFNASNLLSYLLENALIYGEKIKTSAYPLYLFGLMATGDFKATIFVCIVTLICSYLLWLLLSKSFLSIVTTSSGGKKKSVKNVIKKRKSVFVSLVNREFSKFMGSANYMLNCGLATLIIPVASFGLLIKSEDIILLTQVGFSIDSKELIVLSCVGLALMITMNDTAVCSLSLEGKNFWLIKSLPVKNFDVLMSKLALQLILTLPGAWLFSICCWIVTSCDVVSGLMMLLVNTSVVILFGLYCLFLGINGCNLNWTNEITVIKQNLSVVFAIFGGWIAAIVVGFIYINLASYLVSPIGYLFIWLIINVLLSIALFSWIKKVGLKKYEEL